MLSYPNRTVTLRALAEHLQVSETTCRKYFGKYVSLPLAVEDGLIIRRPYPH